MPVAVEPSEAPWAVVISAKELLGLQRIVQPVPLGAVSPAAAPWAGAPELIQRGSYAGRRRSTLLDDADRVMI